MSAFQVQPFVVGDTVCLPQYQAKGVVLRIAHARVEVRIGDLRFWVPRSAIGEVISEEQSRDSIRVSPVPCHKDFVPEIDLHGFRAAEVSAILDVFLDQALRLKHLHVTIVHGKGTGTLRKMVQQYLRLHPCVARYDDAQGIHRGGATYVVLY